MVWLLSSWNYSFFIESEGEKVSYAIEGYQKFKIMDHKMITINNSEQDTILLCFTMIRYGLAHGNYVF
jgi:hypothetical protein